MRKLFVTEFVSLDGVIEAPGGEATHPHSGWVFDFISDEQMRWKLAEVMEAESLLIGRTTYEGFSAAWPPRDGEFADKMNAMPKYVASTTLSGELTWNNSTLLEGNVLEAVAGLKQGDGGPIMVAGSGSLVHALHEAGLIDEYRLMIFPVVLGGGLRLFPDSPDKTVLKLVDTSVFPSGVAVHTYQRAD
jgi:dihydrofolate reductase